MKDDIVYIIKPSWRQIETLTVYSSSFQKWNAHETICCRHNITVAPLIIFWLDVDYVLWVIFFFELDLDADAELPLDANDTLTKLHVLSFLRKSTEILLCWLGDKQWWRRGKLRLLFIPLLKIVTFENGWNQQHW